MRVKPLMTHEIGSLAKPAWRVKAISGKEVSEKDLEEADFWGKRLKIAKREELLEILSKKRGFSDEDKKRILAFSSLYGVKFFESAGLDLVWDGEQHRIEMYEYPIKNIEGFNFYGHVRSFDNKYYRKASCESLLKCSVPYHLQEFQKIQSRAAGDVKIPITGAYTLVDWSYDSYYLQKVDPGVEAINEKKRVARKQFLKEMSQVVIYPNLKALYEAGAQYLQLDEPAATTKKDETEMFIQSVKDSVGDLAGKVFFNIHICYSVYSRLFPKIRTLEGILNEIHLEYANRDSKHLGTTSAQRGGYGILKDFKETKFIVGLGVLDIHTDYIEPPELVRDRILYACKVLNDPQRIMVAPDCGLRTRTWEVAYQKLCNMVEGKNLALKALGLNP